MEEKEKPNLKSLVTNNKPEKISYDELSKIAGEMQNQLKQLYQENYQLKGQLQNQSLVIRTNYLFEVIKNDKYFSSEECNKCAKEIIDSLYPEEDLIEEDQEIQSTNIEDKK